jgi:hypothetical protein
MLGEDLLAAHEACATPGLRNDKSGEPLSAKRFYGLLKTGARSVTGETIVLESIRTAGGLRTSRQAIERFIAKLSGAKSISRPTRRATRQRQVDVAMRELEAVGMV